ncbi:hypothetical protein TNCT_619461, partial [Trichonephila clavata]
MTDDKGYNLTKMRYPDQRQQMSATSIRSGKKSSGTSYSALVCIPETVYCMASKYVRFRFELFPQRLLLVNSFLGDYIPGDKGDYHCSDCRCYRLCRMVNDSIKGFIETEIERNLNQWIDLYL